MLLNRINDCYYKTFFIFLFLRTYKLNCRFLFNPNESIIIDNDMHETDKQHMRSGNLQLYSLYVCVRVRVFIPVSTGIATQHRLATDVMQLV